MVNVMIGKNPLRYRKKVVMAGESKYKGVPAHVKAALMLIEGGKAVRAGDKVQYVKTKTAYGVKPLSMATKAEIDTEKYLDGMKNTLEQLTLPLDLTFDDIMDVPRQATLDGFWAGGRLSSS